MNKKQQSVKQPWIFISKTNKEQNTLGFTSKNKQIEQILSSYGQEHSNRKKHVACISKNQQTAKQP